MKIEYMVLVAIALVAGISVFAVLHAEEDDGELTLPCLYIETEDGDEILSDEDYNKCTVSADNNEDSSYDFTQLTAKVRGRGHTSWAGGTIEQAKKGYKLVFSEPIDLLGLGGAAKTDTWALIANYTDPSLARSFWAYNLASELGLPYTSVAKPVNLYINGYYEGVYNICDKYEISEHSVDIAANDGTVDVGYLVERDSWQYSEGTPGVTYFVLDNGGGAYEIRDPDPDNGSLTSEQYDYIKSVFQTAWDTLNGDDYSAISGLLDLDTFADCYIIHELFSTQDVHGTSFYFYKDKGGKICCGPIWDFDYSSGNSLDDGQDTHRLWAREKSDWYRPLLEFQEFRDIVASKLAAWKDDIVTTITDLRDYCLDHHYDFEHNFTRWNTMASMIWMNPAPFLAMRTWTEHIDYLYDWLMEKLDYMVEVYC